MTSETMLAGSTVGANPRAFALAEINREKEMGSLGTESFTREIRTISLHDFEARRDAIGDELWSAATEVGFFQVVNHGIDLSEVNEAFNMAAKFFSLPDDIKRAYAQPGSQNVGWETLTQRPPSTGKIDQKESYKFNRARMEGLWPSENEVPGFRATLERFERSCWKLAMGLLSCFAERLGLDKDVFVRAHNPSADTYQSLLRLLHYYPLSHELLDDETMWRAGAHTDFGVFTLLFQRQGQGGLQVLPGAEAQGQEWTSVEPLDEAITCNIGDMLMRWSDDRLVSNFHRVRMPRTSEYTGSRYSIAFFTQANKEVIIESPGGSYPPISAEDYLRQRIESTLL